MLIVAGILGGRVMAPLVQIVTHWQSLVNAREAWSRLGPLLAQPCRPGRACRCPRRKGALRVEHLSATAPGSTAPILKGDLHFGLHPGEVLAVIGPSAAGKTTLARAAARPLAGARRQGAARRRRHRTPGTRPSSARTSATCRRASSCSTARWPTTSPASARRQRQGAGRRAKPSACTNSSWPCPRATTPASARRRARCRAASASASAWPGRCTATRRFVVLDEPNSSLDDAGDAALATRHRRAQGDAAPPSS